MPSCPPIAIVLLPYLHLLSMLTLLSRHRRLFTLCLYAKAQQANDSQPETSASPSQANTSITAATTAASFATATSTPAAATEAAGGASNSKASEHSETYAS